MKRQNIIFPGLFFVGFIFSIIEFLPVSGFARDIRPDVNITHPSDGFFTNAASVMKLDVTVKPAAWKKVKKANLVAAILRVDGKLIDFRAGQTREPEVTFTFPVSLKKHAEGAVKLEVKAYAGPMPWYWWFWWRMNHCWNWCQCNRMVGSDAVRGVIDRKAPEVAMIRPANEALINQSKPEIKATISDAVSGVTNSGAIMKLDGAIVPAVFSNGQLAYTPASALPDGGHQFCIQAVDRAGNITTVDTSFTIDATPPVITVLYPANSSAIETNQPAIKAQVNDALSGVVNASVKMTLDNNQVPAVFAQGALTYTPAEPLADGAHQVLVAASDKAGNSSSASGIFTILTALPPPVTNETSGTVGGAVYDAATREPMPGAVVQVRGLSGGIKTSSDGKYTFPVIDFPDCSKKMIVVEYSAPGYISSYRKVLACSRMPVAVEPVFLKKRDMQVTEIGSEGGTAGNTAGTVIAEIPAGAVSSNLPVQLTLYDYGRELPSSLPKSSAFTYAVDLYPDDASFSEPVTVKIANSLGFAAGTPIPVGVFNSAEVRWEHESMGQVSDDGQWVVFQVMHFSQRDANLPHDVSGTVRIKNEGVNGGKQAGLVKRDPGVGIADGSYETEIALPGYRSMGEQKGLRLVYNSESASGRKLISMKAFKDANTGSPATREFAVGLGGKYQQVTYLGEPRTEWGDYFGSMIVDMSEWPTGLYPYEYKVANIYTSSYYYTSSRFGGAAEEETGVSTRDPQKIEAQETGWMPWENLKESSYGAGWSVGGATRVYTSADDMRIMLTAGDGNRTVFLPHMSWPVTNRWVANPQGLGRDYAGGMLIATSNQIIRWKASGEMATVFEANFGEDCRITDVAESEAGTIYFTVAGKGGGGVLLLAAGMAGVMNTATITDTGLYRLAAGGSEAEYITGTDSPFGDPPASVEINRCDGSIYVFYSYPTVGGLVYCFNEAGQGQRVINGIDGTPVAMAYDAVNNRLLVTTDFCLYALQNGEVQFLADVFEYGAGTFQDNGLTVQPDGTIWTVVWNDDGQMLFQWNSQGQLLIQLNLGWIPTQIEVDALGRLWACLNGDNAVMELNIADQTYVSDTAQPQYLQRLTNGWLLADTHGNRKEFDAEGRLSKEQDRNNNTTTYTCDSEGRLTGVTDPAGQTTLLTYNGAGKLASVTDPAGRITQFEVDAAGNLTRVSFPDGTQRTFTYDDQHRIVSKTDPAGQSMQFTLDANGLYTAITYPDNTQTKFDVRRVKAVAPLDPVPGVTRLPGESLPDRVSGEMPDIITNQLGNAEGWILDGRGYLKAKIDPLGNRTDISWGARDTVSSVTDALGRRVEMYYDLFGNLRYILYPDWSQIEMRYTSDYKLPAVVIDKMGRQTLFGYDGSGNMVEATDAFGNASKFTYNSRGLVISSVGPQGNETLYEYDAKGNLSKVIDPLNRATELSYDSAGNLVQVKDAMNRVTQMSYDAMGRLLSSTAADGGVTRYAYDANGNLLTLTDAKGQITRYEYDQMNRLIRSRDALGHERQYIYDGMGNLIQAVNARGETISYGYDAANRLIAKDLAGQDAIGYAYDPVGNLLEISDSDSVVQWAYDIYNRPIQEIQASGTLSYQYDGVGNRVAMSDAIGTTTYSYDALNRLVSLTDPAGRTFVFNYDADSRLASQTAPNGVNSTFSYDLAGQLLGISHEVGGNVIAGVGYGYNSVGNRTSELREDGNQRTFSYDPLDRLLSSVNSILPANNETFSYDAVGNWTINGRVHNALNQLTEDSDYRYTYDAEGSMIQKISKTNSSDIITYAYDVENHLVSVTPSLPHPLTSEYAYDALGRRIAKRVNGMETHYLLDGANVRLEFDGSGSLIGANTHAGLDNLLVRDDYSISSSYYLQQDGLGSTIALSDSSGNVVERYRYSSFGKLDVLNPDFTPKSTDTPLLPYTYTGREWEPETGMYFYRARFYDPGLGRFLSQDPIDLLGGDVNFYTYCANNPLNLIDLFGLEAIEPGIEETTFDWMTALTPVKLPLVAGFIGKLGFVGKWINSRLAAKNLVYRYVSAGEAKIAKELGVVPNVTRVGTAKNVFYSPEKYTSVSAVEEALRIGSKNPIYPTATPTHRLTIDASEVRWNYGGNVEGGQGIELITAEQLPVLRIDILLR